MSDDHKTKGRLIKELALAKQLIAELHTSASEHKRIEEAIKGSEGRYRNLVENAHDVLWVFDLNLGYTYVSPSVKRLRGYSVEEVMKQRLDQVLTPETYKKAMEMFKREWDLEINGQRHGSDWSLTTELELVRKDGTTVWAEVTMNTLYNEKGRIKGIMGITRDISERKQAQEHIKESEKRFRSLIQKSSDIIIILDNKGFITYETPSLESILGYQPGHLIGKSPFELIHPADLKRVESDLNEVYLKTNPGTPTEFRFCKADGTWAYLEAIGQNLLEDPAINGIVITARDITERKRTEEVQREAEAKYHRLYESMMDAFVSTDMAGYIKEYNETYLNMLGYTAEEISALTYKDITPDKWHTFEARIIKKQILQRGYSDIYEKDYRRKDGTIFPVELRTILIKDDAGKPIGMWAIVRDITERKLIENELKKHRDYLEDVVKERTTKLLKAIDQLEKEIVERKQAEDALHVIEEKYHIHFSRSNDVMLTYDNKFRVLSISPNVERVFGYKPQEIIGRPFHELGLLDQGDLDKALDNAMNLFSGKMIPSSIYRFLTKDGITKFVEITGVPLTDKGRMVMVISVARDITDRIEMEKSLHESAEKYRIHFSLTNDVMFSYDNQFRVKNVSPNVERILGYKPEELIGKTLQEAGVLHPDYMDEAIDNALHVLSGKTINSSIYQFITKDGARKFGEVSGTPLIQDGRVVEVVSVARDITERIEIQELLQKSEETSRTLLNASSDSMILLDTSGTMFALNNVTAQRLGKSIKELLGTCLFDHMPKDISDRRKAFFDQAVTSGKTIRFIDQREGRLYSISFYPIRNTYGKVVRIASYAQDVTRLKHDFLKQPAKDRALLP